MKYTVNLVIILITCAFISLPAQTYDAASLSMGSAFAGVARGVEAMQWNPANLGLPRDNWIEINFIGLNVQTANTGFSIDKYERYFTEEGHQGEWDSQEIEDILGLIPDDGFSVDTDFAANALGLAIDHYGFSIQAIGSARGVFPKTPFELVLKGNIREEYSFDDIDGNAFGAIKATFSGSYPFKIRHYFDAFSVGLSLNYFRGIGMAEVLESEGTFYTGPESIQSNVRVRSRVAEGGSGFGMDVGVAGVIDDDLTVSLVLHNLFGSINWDTGTEEQEVIFVVDSAEYVDDLENVDFEPEDEEFPIDEFSTPIPVVLHIGAAYRAFDDLLLSLDLEQAFGDELGYSKQGQLAIGAQYDVLEVLPLRAGMSFGGKWGYTLGLGFGVHLGVFHFDTAYMMHRAAWPTLSNGFSTAFNFKFVF